MSSQRTVSLTSLRTATQDNVQYLHCSQWLCSIMTSSQVHSWQMLLFYDVCHIRHDRIILIYLLHIYYYVSLVEIIFNYFVCVRMHMCESTPATHGGNVDSFQEYILYFFIVGPWCDSNYLYLQSHFSGSLLSFQRQQIRKKPFILCLYPVQCLPRAIHGRCLVN